MSYNKMRAMFGNPHRYQVSLQRLESRHANAGCLLALLFLVPFLARIYNMALVTFASLLYVLLVVPVATGYIKATTVTSFLKRIIIRSVMSEASLIRCTSQHIAAFIQCSHYIYLHLDNIHTTANQVLFNLTAEKVMCPEEKFSCLYVLLFYAVLAYLQQSLQKRHWSQMLHESSTADFVRLTTSFIIVKLGKTIVLTLVLLTFTLQFNNLEPPVAYVFITAVYFFLTQYPGVAGEETKVVDLIRKCDLYELEGLEEWWVPALSRLVTIFCSTVLAVLALFNWNYILAAIISYTNIYVASIQFSEHCWEPLKLHRLDTSIFPFPTQRQLRERGDQTCAVCLDEMRPLTARVTPCRHIFHAYCLRKCIQQFRQCPLCKQNL